MSSFCQFLTIKRPFSGGNETNLHHSEVDGGECLLEQQVMMSTVSHAVSQVSHGSCGLTTGDVQLSQFQQNPASVDGVNQPFHQIQQIPVYVTSKFNLYLLTGICLIQSLYNTCRHTLLTKYRLCGVLRLDVNSLAIGPKTTVGPGYLSH